MGGYYEIVCTFVFVKLHIYIIYTIIKKFVTLNKLLAYALEIHNILQTELTDIIVDRINGNHELLLHS